MLKVFRFIDMFQREAERLALKYYPHRFMRIYVKHGMKKLWLVDTGSRQEKVCAILTTSEPITHRELADVLNSMSNSKTAVEEKDIGDFVTEEVIYVDDIKRSG